MGVWQMISENFSREAMKYKTLFLPEYRVDRACDPTPIKVGETYCRIWLVEVQLAKDIQWFKHRYPIAHSAVRFHHGNQTVTIPYIAEPGHLKSLGTKELGQVIQYNYPLTPLFPFNQGLVEIQAGLFSVAASDPINRFIKVMSRFSELLPIPELSSVVKMAEPVYLGIEELLDIGDRHLELVYQQTFSDAESKGSNFLREGYFAVILAEEHKFNNDALCVVDDSLQVGYPGTTKAFLRDHKPLEGYSYMLFRIEKRSAQDWESLTSIKELVYLAQDAVAEGKYEEVKAILLPAIETTIFRSPDIAKSDRRPMILKIRKTLADFGLQATSGQRPSLHTIMQQPMPEVNSVVEAELSTLERIFKG
ncbi:hypothetical protein NDA01_24300 [Trichocoleus desertorum AS-A10]|uniref:hypothetical protein n=1 Tax=Trichocoleus desertorum TaxID=1481672 RepID=UPI003296967A